jgi:hypothetical protein
VLDSGHACAREPGADLEALARRQRQHGLGEVGLELVEHRLPQARGHAVRDAADDAAERVPAAARLVDTLSHRLCGLRVRAAGRRSLDRLPRDGEQVELGLDGVHLADASHDLADPVMAQHLARHRTGGDAPDGLSRAGAAASLPVADAVLRVIGVVGVRRTIDALQLLVGLGARVLVADEDQDRRAEGPPLEHARQDLGAIRLLPRRREPALAGASPVQLPLDRVDLEREERGTAVDHDADGSAVRLSPRLDPEELPEARSHCARS